jgi:hypothetical protein
MVNLFVEFVYKKITYINFKLDRYTPFTYEDKARSKPKLMAVLSQ